MITQEEELLFMRHVHLVSERIKNERSLTDENLHLIKSLFPDLFSILARMSPEDAYEIFEKYKDHPFYVRDIAVLMTSKGRELATIELQLIKEYAEKNLPINRG